MKEILAAFLITLSGQAASASPFSNLERLMGELGFPPAYTSHRPTSRVRVAILDNGFAGYKERIGETLLTDTIYHPGVIPPPQEEEEHGRVMAELLTALVTNNLNSDKIPLELHLYPAFGYSNLEAAVQSLIREKIQVVLYSQVWEYGGNNDGKGFINYLIKQATNAGILWVNAAGNFRGATFNSKIEANEDHWVRLPGPNQSVQARCQTKTESNCHVRLVLSWNDFKDDVDVGTDKDLDLVLTDDALNVVQASSLKQQKELPKEEPGSSKYPREIIEADVEPGLYYIRVKDRSRNFDRQRDWLRVTLSGTGMQMLATDDGESLLNPADNSEAITVGAIDSQSSSMSRRLDKPELLSPSTLDLGDNRQAQGSSVAATIVAAGVAILKSFDPQTNRFQVLTMMRPQHAEPGFLLGRGLPLEALEFGPTGRDCFTPIHPECATEASFSIIRTGGIPVETTHGIKIFTPDDPFYGVPSLRRVRANDMLMAGRPGLYLWPRERQDELPACEYEIVQIPQNQWICGPTLGPNKAFHMPRF